MKRQDAVTSFICELSKGFYLQIVPTEDGNGTYWTETSSIWEAYWDKDLEKLKGVVATEFVADSFSKGYPKYHRVRFSYEKIAKGGQK